MININMENKLRKNRHSFHSENNERDVQFGSRLNNLRRPYSLTNLVSNSKSRSSEVYESASVFDEPGTPADNSLSLVASVPIVENNVKKNKGYKAIVSIVLVEARDLPKPPEDGCNHTLYCKIRLGEETIKSKAVTTNRHIEWRERFKMKLNKDHVLRISLWDKGKRRNFMGSCVIDLSHLEQERTHEIWHKLDDGYGSLHLSVTICSVTNGDVALNTHRDVIHNEKKYAFYNFNTNWKVVGELHVRVISGKGFIGKPNAYCVLELDNERVQTPASRGAEPTWNKSYVFNVHDISSLLDLKVCEDTLVNALFSDCLGKVAIPLLRIRNGETRWYALKDKTKKNIAKGNCPRVLLELSVYWNPVQASMKLFRPKQVKHVKKPPKFDISLVLKNFEFVKDTFLLLIEINEVYKQTFEWDSQDLSAIALFAWILFWYYFELWMVPLFLIIPFLFYWVLSRKNQEKSFMRKNTSNSFNTTDTDQNENDKEQSDKSITGKIQGLADTTIFLATAVDYVVCVGERLINLVTFKVPFLSFLVMLILLGTSLVLFLVPIKYLMMVLGIYKFTRKTLNPERVPNNDLLDFISHIPDNEDLKEWKELSVPEPNQRLSAY